MFSKIIPSFFTIKEGSTSHPYPLSSGAREKTALLGARNRFALRLADHQRSSPDYAVWDRLGAIGDTSFADSSAFDVAQGELKHLGLLKFAGVLMYVWRVKNKK